MKIAVITPIPTPYRDPFWATLAKDPAIDLHVLYCSSGKTDRPWEENWNTSFSRTKLSGCNLAKFLGPEASCYWNSSIIRILRREQFDGIIVGGYNHLTILVALLWARIFRIPYFLMNESYLDQPRSWWRKIVKYPYVRFVVGHAAGFFPTGTLAMEYLERYGGDTDRMCFVPNVPDVEALDMSRTDVATERADFRAENGIDDGAVILFVSRLISLKRVDLLLTAFAEIAGEQPANLVILGDGPMRSEWEQLAVSLGVADRVTFAGFIQPEELPRWYTAADLFVLPSIDETWSVVVLEALSSGVPVVITDLVGCYADVINDPGVGTVVRAGDKDALAQAVRDHLAHPMSHSTIAELWRPVWESLRYSSISARVISALRDWCGERHGASNPTRPEREKTSSSADV